MSEKKKYDSTVARIAGNIAAGIATSYVGADRLIPVMQIAVDAVELARAIVLEVERTEPPAISEGAK